MRAVLIQVAIGILSIILVNTILEAYFVDQMDPLQRARRILVPDATLGWRQRPHLNQTFERVRLSTDENGFRILDGSSADSRQATLIALGPSSTMGWGVEAQDTYTGILQRTLVREKVLNAGEVGFSSEQGLRLFKQLAKQTPQRLIVAYGVNDLDRFRFFGNQNGSDFDWFQQSVRISAFELSMNTLVLGQILYRGWGELQNRWLCSTRNAPSTRVSVEQFEKNMAELVGHSQKRAIVIGTPFRLPDSFRSLNPQNPLRTSDQLFAEAARLAEQNHCGESYLLLKDAKLQDAYRVEADVRRMNNLLRKLSLTTNSAFIDADALLQPLGAGGFVDPVHPNAAGHRLIGQEILAKLNEHDAE